MSSTVEGQSRTEVEPRASDPMGMFSVSVTVLTTVLWGGTAVSNQIAMDALPPVFLGGARFSLAMLFMLGWCILDGSPLLLRRGQWGTGWVLGLLLFLQILTFNVGAHWSSSSHASILVNSYIFWVAACESLLFKSVQLHLRQWLGLVLAAVGCAWVFLNTGDAAAGSGLDVPTVRGDLVLALSGFILGVKILYTKHAVRRIAPGTIIMWHDVFGSLIFFACSALMGEQMLGPMTPTVWVALLFAGFVISGFCFGANAWLLRRHGASQVSVFSFATPIFGVALGVLLRGDALTWGLLIGGILVAIGIFLVNSSSGRIARSGVAK